MSEARVGKTLSKIKPASDKFAFFFLGAFQMVLVFIDNRIFLNKQLQDQQKHRLELDSILYPKERGLFLILPFPFPLW